MSANIVSYFDMCTREGTSLQRGMNFRLHGRHSVILMSLRPNAPYRDRFEDDGAALIYEGHDVPNTSHHSNPKAIDQQERLASGLLTENGKFHDAAQSCKTGRKPPDLVRVYEKIKPGIWSDNGYFHLVDSWIEHDGTRNVFKFRLLPIEADHGKNLGAEATQSEQAVRRRVIPTSVKIEVWKRDRGECVVCGASDELHFDHVVPFSKGGTSMKPENVQLLCARHNLEKSDNIQ